MDAEVLNWIKHGLALDQQLLSKHWTLPTAQVTWLRWLVKAEVAALARIDAGEQPVGVLAVVADYMIRHARLQIERSAGRITDEMFWAACGRLREELREGVREQQAA